MHVYARVCFTSDTASVYLHGFLQVSVILVMKVASYSSLATAVSPIHWSDQQCKPPHLTRGTVTWSEFINYRDTHFPPQGTVTGRGSDCRDHEPPFRGVRSHRQTCTAGSYPTISQEARTEVI